MMRIAVTMVVLVWLMVEVVLPPCHNMVEIMVVVMIATMS